MTESAIVRQILDWLAAERIFAFRLNTSATKIGDRFFRSHGLGPGAADILALPKANHRVLSLMPAWIEVKTSTGRQSPEQINFQAFVEEMGHKYLLARSIDDVRELWEASKR